MRTQADGAGELTRTQVESTVVRAHHTPPGREVRSPSIQASRQQALERSRGGLMTKLHTISDGRGRNLATRLTPGQDADTTQPVWLVDTMRVARPRWGADRARAQIT